MKILIDADGCPVVDISIKVAKMFDIDVTLICDTSHSINKEGANTVLMPKGKDSVDFALVNRVEKGDIVVTQDYGLATMVLAKVGNAINQNGLIYNNDNIDQLLLSRHISSKIRNSRGRIKGPKKRQREDDIKFEQNLINLCKTLIK